MSVISDERDLESLCVDISTGDLTHADIDRIADAMPTKLLVEALARRLVPGEKIEAIFAWHDDEQEKKIRMLFRVFDAWKRHPQWRLGQLISNAMEEVNVGLFHVQDDTLTHLMAITAARYNPNEE